MARTARGLSDEAGWKKRKPVKSGSRRPRIEKADRSYVDAVAKRLDQTCRDLGIRLGVLEDKLMDRDREVTNLNERLQRAIEESAKSERVIQVVADIVKAAGFDSPAVHSIVRRFMERNVKGNSSLGNLSEEPRRRPVNSDAARRA